ncbi:MAG: helix-turn-helix transcriptional regulator [Planctomycetes bacterium]|nr:helix-turn-helix transcriptional regulator [Planctomycetota bacterium]
MAGLDNLINQEFPASPDPTTAALRLVFDSLGLIEAKGDHTYHRHQHLNYEIIVVDHGRYHCTLNGVEMRLRRNHILMVKPGDWHEDFLTPPVRYYSVRARIEGAPLLPKTSPFRADARPDQQLVDAPRDQFWPLIDKLRHEGTASDAMSPHLQQAVLAEFFWRLVRLVPTEAIDPRFLDRSDDQRFLSALNQLFLAHENARLGIPRMAARLGMSQSSLTARCRARFKMSPAQAFRRYKMERALALLTGTEMTVTEVSNHLGFENPYHFSRVFKQVHGKPPSQV